jgi:hypothetical protein
MISGIAGLFGLYAFEVPSGNREPLLVALGVILGWGSNVVQSEFGGSALSKKLGEQMADSMKP